MYKRILSALTGFAMAFTMLGAVPSAAETDVSADVNAENINGNEVSIEGTNALGDMLVQKINDAEESDDMGFTIQNVAVDGKNVTVEYSFIKSCTMVVGIFDDEGTVMLGKGVADIVTGSSSETVTIDIDTMPDHFLVKVFMVDSISYRPLGEAYTCELYTKMFQDFMALTTDDFDSESVLNLDEDKTNNFIVLKDGITRLDETDGEIVSSDDSDEQSPVTHTISGASDRVKALKAGDIFSAGDIENIVIAKVGSITVDGDTAVITEGDIKGDEVFKVIKIDTGIDDADITIDTSTADEGVTYLGQGVDIPTIPEDYDGTGKLYDLNNIPETETQELNGDIVEFITPDNLLNDPPTFKIDSEDWKIEDDSNKSVNVKANVIISVILNYNIKLFFDDDNDFDYLRLETDCKIEGSATLELDGGIKKQLASILCKSLGVVNIFFNPEIYFRGKASISINISIGVKSLFEINNEGKLSDQSPEPYKDLTFKAKLDLSVGINPGIEFDLLKDLYYFTVGSEIGLHCVLERDISVSENVVHNCSICFSGSISFEITPNITYQGLWESKPNVIKVLKFIKPLYRIYYSESNDEVGTGICPHRNYKFNIKLIDRLTRKYIKDADVTLTNDDNYREACKDYHMNENGEITVYMEEGWYLVKAVVDGGVYKSSRYPINKGDRFNNVVIPVYYDHSASKKNSSSSKPDDSSSSKPDSSSSKPDDTSSKPDSDSSAPENLKLTKTKKTLDYKKGNGMKLLEGGVPNGCMGFIDDNDTLFIWGFLPIKKESDYLKTDYSYYSIPNIKKVQIQNSKLMFLTKNNDLYIWGWNYRDKYYYEKPTLIATNVKDFCLDYNNYAYIKTNGDLYVSGKFGSGDNSKTYDNYLMMKNVRSVSLGHNYVGACITENDELYMWGYNNAHQIIPYGDETYFDITKIADDVKDVEIQINCTYYITNNGDLHTRGIYYENYLDNTIDFSDQIRMKGIKEVSSASFFSDNSLILAENGDLYIIGNYTNFSKYSELYPEMKSFRTNENNDLIITLKNGDEITIPAEERLDYFYKPTKMASNVKKVTNLFGSTMYIDNNNEIYVFGHNFGGLGYELFGIYDRIGYITDFDPDTPVKLDDIYAQLPTIESETQSENADTSAVAEDDFTGLMPDCIYNVYGFNEDYMDLSNEGLAYIDQFVTDSEGNLPFDKASVSGSEALFWKAVPMTRLSIANAKIEVKDLSYTGEEQFIEPTVTLDGKTLVLNYDYFIAQGDSATDAGEYTGIICGMGEYKGEAEFTYNVTGGGKLGDVNGDNAINVTDISLVAAHVKGRKALSANKFALADINKDGSVNVTDISRIAAHVKGVKSIK